MTSASMGGYNNSNSMNVKTTSGCNVEVLVRELSSSGGNRISIYQVTNMSEGATFSIVTQGNPKNIYFGYVCYD